MRSRVDIYLFKILVDWFIDWLIDLFILWSDLDFVSKFILWSDLDFVSNVLRELPNEKYDK